MANIKTTQKEWDRAREYFEAGLSLGQIEQRTGITKDRVSKKAKNEGWPKATQKQQLVQDAVRVEQAKATLSPVAFEIHEELVNSKVAQLKFLRSAAIMNVSEAMAMGCMDQQEFRARGDTILKAGEMIDPKNPNPTTAIQINNNQPGQDGGSALTPEEAYDQLINGA